MNLPVLTSGYYYITLDQLTLSLSMGIHNHELEKPQRVVVSAAVIHTRKQPLNDSITTVKNYDYLRNAIQELASSRHFNLQETFCEEILQICRNAGSLGAFVKSEKPDVYPDASVGCQMNWIKDGGVFLK